MTFADRVRLLLARFERPEHQGWRRWWPLIALASVVLVAFAGLAALRGTRTPPVPQLPYSTVASALTAQQVRAIEIIGRGARLHVTFRTPRLVGAERPYTEAITSLPAGAVTVGDLDRWVAAGAEVRVRADRVPDSVMQALLVLLVFGVGMGALVWQRRGGGQRAAFETTPPERLLTLADVGGAKEAQADLRDVIAYLKDPERFRRMGAKGPKGVLLVGPPGTGKTLLARAVAGEAGCNVIIAAGSDFNEMYVGVGAQRVRALSQQARKDAPCIVFIDEFDSVAGRRGRPNNSSEEETTLNQLLVEMDGTVGSEGVIWMAATNREDMLDPAVRRPGRFDRIVEVGLPTQVDRLEILRIHAGRTPMAPDIDLERLSALTVGYSGAELANLINEAAIIAVHEESELVTARHLEAARDKILLGRIRAGVTVRPDERKMIALHEAGHVVVGFEACPEDVFHKVTIEARGRTLGAAHFAPDTDRHLHTIGYLRGIICKALGGRAAELVFCGPELISSGAGGDLIQATNVARKMVAEFGMSERVGLISADAQAHGGAPSGQLLSEIDGAVRELIAEQMRRAEAIVRDKRELVQAIADELLAKNALSAAEVFEIAARFDGEE